MNSPFALILLFLIVAISTFMLGFYLFAITHFILLLLFIFWLARGYSDSNGKGSIIGLFAEEGTHYSRRIIISILKGIFVYILLFLSISAIDFRFDLSLGGVFSLKSLTTSELQSLDSAYKFYLIDTGDRAKLKESSELLDLISKASTSSSGGQNIKVSLLNPLYDPELIHDLGVMRGTALAIKKQSLAEGTATSTSVALLNDISEGEVLAALMRLERKEESFIYYSIGHGEPDLLQDQPDSLSRFSQIMDDELISVRQVSLQSEDTILDPKVPLFLVAPKIQLDEVVVGNIYRHVNNGGTVVVAAEYASVTSGLSAIFTRYGMAFEPRPIVRVLESDTGERQISADLPIRMYRNHPITSFLKGNASLLFSEAVPIVSSASVASSSQIESFLSYQIGASPSVDLGVIAETVSGGKIVAFGDASWLTNKYISRAFNADLARGLLLWSNNLLGISDVSASLKAPVVVNQQTEKSIFLTYLVILEIVLLFGYILYFRRIRRSFRQRLKSDQDLDFMGITSA
jgi:hypothetical protein